MAEQEERDDRPGAKAMRMLLGSRMTWKLSLRTNAVKRRTRSRRDEAVAAEGRGHHAAFLSSDALDEGDEGVFHGRIGFFRIGNPGLQFVRRT